MTLIDVETNERWERAMNRVHSRNEKHSARAEALLTFRASFVLSTAKQIGALAQTTQLSSKNKPTQTNP